MWDAITGSPKLSKNELTWGSLSRIRYQNINIHIVGHYCPTRQNNNSIEHDPVVEGRPARLNNLFKMM